MYLRKMAFGFGLITGAALTISLPYFACKMKEMTCNDDQENHESKTVKKLKEDIKNEFSNISDEFNENVSQFMNKMEKKISSKKQKKKKKDN